MQAWNDQLDGASGEDLIVDQNSYYTADLTIRPPGLRRAPAGREPNPKGTTYPTMVVVAKLSPAYMILQEITFLHERLFKFILQSNCFPPVRMVQGQCLRCAIFAQIKIIQCRTSSYLLGWRLSIIVR